MRRGIELSSITVSSTARGEAKKAIEIYRCTTKAAMQLPHHTNLAASALYRYLCGAQGTVGQLHAWHDCQCSRSWIYVNGLHCLSCYGFLRLIYPSPTEASQLRLAPNRPCMTLVYNVEITLELHACALPQLWYTCACTCGWPDLQT